MEQDNSTANNGLALRYGMFIPLAFMIASIVSCCFSYSNAKQNITDDLNDAMFALANENSELWTRPDTIAAIRQMYEATHKPLKPPMLISGTPFLKMRLILLSPWLIRRISRPKSVRTKLHRILLCLCRNVLPMDSR